MQRHPPFRAYAHDFAASRAAWDCFWDRLPHPSTRPDERTACGWHFDFLAFYKPVNPTNIVLTGATEVEAVIVEAVLRELEELSGIGFVFGPARYAVEVDVGADSPCGPMVGERIGCSRHPQGWNSDGMHGGKVWIAEGLSEAEFGDVLRHEILHAVFDLLHTDSDSILNPQLYAPKGYTKQDRELLRMFKLIPAFATPDEIRERACIGADGICKEAFDAQSTS